jgi:hypothetical protein
MPINGRAGDFPVFDTTLPAPGMHGHKKPVNPAGAGQILIHQQGTAAAWHHGRTSATWEPAWFLPAEFFEPGNQHARVLDRAQAIMNLMQHLNAWLMALAKASRCRSSCTLNEEDN